jgi:hypothetical protein
MVLKLFDLPLRKPSYNLGTFFVISPNLSYSTSAVVRGAVAKGIEGDGRPRILNRKCRRHYGTEVRTKFIHGKHRLADKVLCEHTGILKADHQMAWLLDKGQDMSTTSGCHAKHGLCYQFCPSDNRIRYLNLLATNSDDAPYRSKHEVRHVLFPVQYDWPHQKVYKVAQLEANLQTVPKALFRDCRTPSGALYHEIHFDVEISVQSSLEFSLPINGNKYGSVTAKYT